MNSFLKLLVSGLALPLSTASAIDNRMNDYLAAIELKAKDAKENLRLIKELPFAQPIEQKYVYKEGSKIGDDSIQNLKNALDAVDVDFFIRDIIRLANSNRYIKRYSIGELKSGYTNYRIPILYNKAKKENILPTINKPENELSRSERRDKSWQKKINDFYEIEKTVTDYNIQNEIFERLDKDFDFKNYPDKTLREKLTNWLKDGTIMVNDKYELDHIVDLFVKYTKEDEEEVNEFIKEINGRIKEENYFEKSKTVFYYFTNYSEVHRIRHIQTKKTGNNYIHDFIYCFPNGKENGIDDEGNIIKRPKVDIIHVPKKFTNPKDLLDSIDLSTCMEPSKNGRDVFLKYIKNKTQELFHRQRLLKRRAIKKLLKREQPSNEDLESVKNIVENLGKWKNILKEALSKNYKQLKAENFYDIDVIKKNDSLKKALRKAFKSGKIFVLPHKDATEANVHPEDHMKEFSLLFFDKEEGLILLEIKEKKNWIKSSKRIHANAFKIENGEIRRDLPFITKDEEKQKKFKKRQEKWVKLYGYNPISKICDIISTLNPLPVKDKVLDLLNEE